MPASGATGSKPRQRDRCRRTPPPPGAPRPASGRRRRHPLQRVSRISVGPDSRREPRSRHELRAKRQRDRGLSTELARVRASLASAIQQIAPHAATVAVLNYYQPIPVPGQLADGTAASGLGTNLVCAGLKANASSTAAAAQVVLSALNDSIAGAVGEARAHGVRNVTLVDVSKALNGHGICTAHPWVFSSEPVPDATLAADGEHILAAKACTAAGSALTPIRRAPRWSRARHQAEQSLTDYVWRTAHPTAAGQRALSVVVERALRGRAQSIAWRRDPRRRLRLRGLRLR